MFVTDGAAATLLLQVLTIIVSAAAVYGGVRADIRNLIAGMAKLEKAVERAHLRMDDHLKGHP